MLKHKWAAPFAVCCLGLSFALTAPKASAQTYTTIDVPGATETDANAINTAKTIAGFSLDASGIATGFTRTASGTIQKLRVPGASDTRAYGINDKNQVVGWYISSTDGLTHGFLFNQGKYNKIDPPGSQTTNVWTISNDGTIIVGTYQTSDGVFHGFTRQGGTYTTYDAPNSTLTEFTGVNKAGSKVGIYIDTTGTQFGFTLQGTTFTKVAFPGSGVVVTATDRINDTNEIVGLYGTNTAGPFLGYKRQAGKYTTISYPNSTETRCRGLDNAGDIVGRYTDAAGVVHGMLVTP